MKLPLVAKTIVTCVGVLACTLMLKPLPVFAWTCSGYVCDTNLNYCQVDCSRYTETFIKDPTYPASVTPDNQTINPVFQHSGCSGVGASGTDSIGGSNTVSNTESLTTTYTQGSSGEIGLDVGADAKVGLNLSYATSVSGLWSDSHTTQWNTTQNWSVGPCQLYSDWWTGDSKSATFLKEGYMSWDAPIRQGPTCNGSFDMTGSGSCDETDAKAAGSNLIYEVTSKNSGYSACTGTGCAGG